MLQFLNEKTVTIDQALKALSLEYGGQFVEYVFSRETGEVKGFLQFLVNGRSVSDQKNLQTVLKDGDVLAILPPVGGG